MTGLNVLDHVHSLTWTQLVTLVLVTLGIIVVGQVCNVLWVMIKRRQAGFSLKKQIPGPPLHWFWGNANVIKTPSDLLTYNYKWTREYRGLRIGRLGPFLWEVAIYEPGFIKAVMSTAEPKEPMLYGFLEPWIGDGLLLSTGKKWARNRRLLTPGFHFEILKPYMEIFSGSGMTLVNKWKSLLQTESSLEMFDHVSLMTLDSLLKCIFGFDSGCQLEKKKSPYIQGVYNLSAQTVERMMNPLLHNDVIFNLSPLGFRFRRDIKIVHEYSKNVIKSRRLDKEKGVVNQKKYLDFVDILLDARDSDGKGLTDTEIQHEVDTFMFEGHDTTASGISWFLYNMARFPEHQQKCRDEIREVLGDRDEVTYDDLHKLEYLTLCMKESLRIHPPVPNIGRRLTKPLPLPNGVTLPADTWVTLSIICLHHNAAVWEDPEKFDPLRFTLENSEKRSPHAFVPFSAGPRNCIGQSFAMNEMKAVCSLILKHFNLEVDHSKPVIQWPELILRTRDGLWLKPSPIQT